MLEATKQDKAIFTEEEQQLLRGRFAGTWSARISILVVVLFLGFLGIWVFSSMIAQAKTPAPWHSLVHLQKFIKGFHLAGVTMGMTPGMVRELHPKLGMLPDTGDGMRATFVSGYTPYTVWFADLKGMPQAYRIRYHRHYKGESEDEALNVFGSKLGRPLSTHCIRSRLASSSKTCIFKWLRNGVDVVVVSKLIRFINADPRTYISITATDTLTAAKLRKRKQQEQVAAASAP